MGFPVLVLARKYFSIDVSCAYDSIIGSMIYTPACNTFSFVPVTTRINCNYELLFVVEGGEVLDDEFRVVFVKCWGFEWLVESIVVGAEQGIFVF